jgi:hypothetical protein
VVARIPQVDETTFGDNIFPFEKRLGEARGFRGIRCDESWDFTEFHGICSGIISWNFMTYLC